MLLEEYKDKYAPELIAALDQFQKIHAPKGFIDTAANGEALLLHLAQNNMPPTLASLEQSVAMHTPERGFKMYYTPDEQALNAARAEYDANTLAIFDRWFSFQHIERTPRAAAAVLSECRGHVVDKSFLDLALGRAASKGKIVFSKAPGQDGYVPGQYSNTKNENLLHDRVDPSTVTDALAWKIHDFRSTKGLAMVQIRCLGRFETKSEAFACPNIPQQTVCFFQIFLIDRWSRNLINDRAVPMVEQFFSRLPSGALA